MTDLTLSYTHDGDFIPRKVMDVKEIAELWEDPVKRIVEQNRLECKGKTILVSTVFLGIDHGFGLSSSKPVLFETMVLGAEIYTDDEDKIDQQWRYTDVRSARIGHSEMLLHTAQAIKAAIETDADNVVITVPKSSMRVIRMKGGK